MKFELIKIPIKFEEISILLNVTRFPACQFFVMTFLRCLLVYKSAKISRENIFKKIRKFLKSI